MRTSIIATLLLTSCLACMAGEGAAKPPDPNLPEWAILAPVSVLRSNDALAFFRNLPAEDQARIKADYELSRRQQVPTGDLAEANVFLGRLLTPEGVDQIAAELAPKLAEMDPMQMSMGVKMGGAFLTMGMMQGPDGKPKQDQATMKKVQMVQALINDLGDWIGTAGLNEEAKLKRALTALSVGAKALKVKDVAELQKLELEDLLGRLGPVLASLKEAAKVYDIGIDPFLDSVSVTSTKGATAGKALLTVRFTAFGKPYELPVDAVLKDKHWTIDPSGMVPTGMMGGPPGMDMDAGAGNEPEAVPLPNR